MDIMIDVLTNINQAHFTFYDLFFSKEPNLKLSISTCSHSKMTQTAVSLMWLEMKSFYFVVMRRINTCIWNISIHNKNN